MSDSSPLEWLYSTQLFGVKLGLQNVRRLLRESLAHPATRVRVLHVAGTNGKGSVCALAESVARASGLHTGLFTSPHLIDFRERIRTSGSMIPQDAMDKELTFLRDLVADWDPHPTFFELTLAAALRWFKAQQCELLILETGLGGRLDATNAIPSDLAVITPIGHDHEQWLGNTLTEIAYEKAGIIKRDKPVISAPQNPEARTVLMEVADEQRAPLTFIEEPLTGYGISLEGDHQQWNAALALEALHQLRIELHVDAVRSGLAHARWPGRFDYRKSHRIVFDAAHNTEGARTLATTWKKHFSAPPSALLFGAVREKNAQAMLGELAPLNAPLHLCPVDSPRTLSHEELTEAATAAGFPASRIHRHPDLSSALQTARNRPGTALLTGSIYLVGEALAQLEDSPRVQTDQ